MYRLCIGISVFNVKMHRKLIITLALVSAFNLTNSITPASLGETFQKGVTAYTQERWSRCIEKFEESIHLYKLYKSIIVNCRIKCNMEKREALVEDIDDLAIYEKYFYKRDCLNKCQENEFKNVNLDKEVTDSVVRDMQSKRPYEYLHVCYFQMHMFIKAASSAYTFLVANPNDQTMKENVHYYFQQPEVDPNEVVDMESDEYVVLYFLGRKSYTNKNWAETAASMAAVLKEYFLAEDNCRVECEHLPGQEWSSEFVITMSNNIASLLHCRQQCQDKLKALNYTSGVEFIADVLNYLQISYYHLEKYDDAARAVGSYLTLMPEDEDMVENEKFYSTHVKKTAFDPIADVVHYYKRDKYEKDLLNFFHKGSKDYADSNTV